MAVYEKLSQVQSRLNVPKNQVNKFGGYNYRSCEDILEAVKPLLTEVGAVLTVGDDLILIGERYYIRSTATFIDTETGETVTNRAYAREADEKKGMDLSQITGSASSYARKYALNGLFCLDDVKDDDATSTKTKNGKLQDMYVASLKDELARTGVSQKSLLENYGAKTLASLEFDQYTDAMDRLKKKPSKEDKYVEADEKDLPWNQ